MLVSLPVPIVCWVMGASPDARVGAFAAGIVAVYLVAFLWLRARRRREWAKEWQGPARMFRAMPPSIHMVGDDWIQDRGHLRAIHPDAKYIFDEPALDTALPLYDLVLLGARAGIMDFLDKHRKQAIENRRKQYPGIYMQVKPYQPVAERYEVLTVSPSDAIMRRAGRHLAGWALGRNPATDLVGGVVDLSEALDPLLKADGDVGSQEPACW
ncbi:MAG: hypothetical protein JJE23_00920 [Thermoleophilia bacterium]|nr:hypothetical protein [Thermoleophilia bacterium]